MTERIADSSNAPNRRHEVLYDKWADTGAGLLITGNVMIDRIHLESAGNVCVDEHTPMPALKSWARAATKHGNQCWVQISHAGRQTNRFGARHPLAPSPVQLKKLGLFGVPRAMTDSDIAEVIKGFTRAAVIAKEAGFTGVQIHAAHGYLLSQFLSPLTNVRTDRWGGSNENRSRLLMEIVRHVREAVGNHFPLSVKLNSADFMNGGLTEQESIDVVQRLDRIGIDLLEISGGTYEKTPFLLLNSDEGIQRREAFFIDFAGKVREVSSVPLMVTGGFRSLAFCEDVLRKGEVDFIGMARPFISHIDEIADFLSGHINEFEQPTVRTGIAAFEDSAEAGFYARELIRIADNEPMRMKPNALGAASFLLRYEFMKAMKRKKP